LRSSLVISELRATAALSSDMFPPIAFSFQGEPRRCVALGLISPNVSTNRFVLSRAAPDGRYAT